MKKRSFLKIWLGALFVISIFFLKPDSLLAATLTLSPSSGTYKIGDTISVAVLVNSTDQAMNAASAIISFPRNILEGISFSKIGSILALWAEEPAISNQDGTVRLEGVALNPGFIGTGGKIITMFFKVKALGKAELKFSSASVLANDGRGTNILISSGSGAYNIKNPPPPNPQSSSTTPTTPISSTSSPLSLASSTPSIIFINEAEHLLLAIIPLVALVIILLLLFYYGLIKYRSMQRKVAAESSEAQAALKKAFFLLRENVTEQIKTLEKTQKGRKLTEEELIFLDQLKTDLNQAESYVSKEIKDITS